MWAYPQTNLASLQTLSSSCLSLCLSLYSRARRDKARGAIERARGVGGRRIEGGGSVHAEKGNMEDALSSMPLVLQPPERGDEEMDPRVWKGLPNELQDRVLACLPVPLLLQFRLVCKRWNEVIGSTAFSKLRAEMPYCGPHFVVFEFHRPESSAAYDPWLHKWYVCLSQIPVPVMEGEVISVCAAGGLLCVVLRSTWFAGPARILLCNPVNRTYKELPRTWIDTQAAAQGQLWKPMLVALVVDHASNSFQVVAAGASSSCMHTWSAHTCFCRVTEVYDSKTGRWELAGELPWVSNDRSLGYHSHTHAVCGDNLYCVGFRDDDYDLMMVFNLKRREWSKSRVEMPQLSGAHILLFERRGALVLVQQAEKSYGLPAVYTLVPTSNKWTQVRTLLPRNGKKFEELFHNDEDLFWVGQGDQLFFVSPKFDQAIMYNICSKSWTITPQSRFLRRHPESIFALPFDFSLQVHSSDSTSGQSWLKY